jgi:hypothetical protein
MKEWEDNMKKLDQNRKEGGNTPTSFYLTTFICERKKKQIRTI